MKEVLGSITKAKMDLSSYIGSMNIEKVIDSIIMMDNFFEYEEMEDEKKVKFIVTKLKRHIALSWDGVQDQKRRKNKKNIKR